MPKKLRVFELAEELGLDSQEILRRLKLMGEFVRSASSTIEPPVERKLRAGSTIRQQKARERQDRGLGMPRPPRPDPFTTGYNPFAATQGMPAPQRSSLARSSAPRSSAPRSSPPRQRPPADPYLMDWSGRWFEPAQRREWVAAGIGDHNAAQAEQCLTAGLSPSDLAETVDGRRVGDRLRGGESAATVAARLQELRMHNLS